MTIIIIINDNMTRAVPQTSVFVIMASGGHRAAKSQLTCQSLLQTKIWLSDLFVSIFIYQ